MHTRKRMIAFWLGGAPASACVGLQTVEYSENVALGANTFESHDMTVLDDSGSCLFLAFMLSRQWLEDREKTSGRTRLAQPACAWPALGNLMIKSGIGAIAVGIYSYLFNSKKNPVLIVFQPIF